MDRDSSYLFSFLTLTYIVLLKFLYMQPVKNNNMTSEERHERRYQRRKQKRQEKIKQRALQHTNKQEIFGFLPMIRAYRRCKQNVTWKGSTQIFMEDLIVSAKHESSKLLNGTWRSYGFYEFDIIERGKPRHIKSVSFPEKGVQRTLCDNCLIPILQPSLIYDNGATLPGRGTSFSLARFTNHLMHHYHLYGRQGGIFFFDFSEYFKNILNKPLVDRLYERVIDEEIMKITQALIFAFGPKGLGLGSQVSQISAVFYPNPIDHFIKDKLGIHGYGRYMDDGYIIWHNIEQLKIFANKFIQKCQELGIIMNKKKCLIKKLTSHFTFLKTRFFITETGRIVRRGDRKNITKQRKRLRTFFKYFEQGRLTYEEVFYNFHSWLCSKTDLYNYHVKLNMICYFNYLFRNYKDCYYMPKKTNRRYLKVLKHLATVAIYNPI